MTNRIQLATFALLLLQGCATQLAVRPASVLDERAAERAGGELQVRNFSVAPGKDAALLPAANLQPGDIILEGSVELRKKLFGFVEGALFVDGGNVWTFKARTKKDENGDLVDNGNSKFMVNQFYREIGVGTGFGLRFNFSFLILRFDVGIKVYDPARDEGARWVLDNAKPFKPFGVDKEPMIYNIGIGYPF